MARITASTRQPPAGGPGSASDPDELLRGLRRGERDDFVRYFQLFRAPVYDFSLRLLHDEAAAVAATAEALSAAFRRVVLDAGPADLQAVTYKCAVDACLARVAAAGASAADAASAAGTASAAGDVQHDGPRDETSRPASEDGRRVAAALDSLEPRQRAALLLHDVQGLSAARLAIVFGVTAEAAAALLFRSRVTFRGAFHALSAHAKDRTCRQAEQAVAGTVGVGLSSGELERLRSHATYCRPCRKAMRRWQPDAFGLALALEQAPPPEALAAPPVFGAAAVALAAPVTAAGLLARLLLPAGRALRSRAAAYVVAAACLALAAGLALNEQAVRRFVVFESVGPAVELVRAPRAEAASPDRSRDGAAESAATSAGVVGASFGVQSGILAGRTAAGAAVPAPSADGSPAAEPNDGAATRDGSRDAVATGDGSADAAGATKGAAAEKRRHGKTSRNAHSASGPHKDRKAHAAQKAHSSHKAPKATKTHKSKTHKSKTHKSGKKEG